MTKDERDSAILRRYRAGRSSMRAVACSIGCSAATVSRVVATAGESPMPKRDQLQARETSIAMLRQLLLTAEMTAARILQEDPKASPVADDIAHLIGDIHEHIETLWDSTVTILDGNGVAL